MKYFYYLVLFIVFSGAQAQYKGGSDDGTASFTLLAQNPLQNIYKGGTNDGFSASMIVVQNQLNNIYSGGAGDGFSQLIITAQNSLSNIYAGGINDGFAYTITNNQNILNNIYAGGTDDGFAGTTVLLQNPLSNIFSGGINDGFAGSGINNQNPLNNIYGGGVNDGFATILVNNQNLLNPLPLRLTEFNGRWQQQNISLWWRTAIEDGVSHFEVQRSINDATSFVTIASIQAAGNTTTEKRYDLIDRKLPDGNIFYYRLKSVDLNGDFTYSAIIWFTKQAKETVYTIHPNPGSGLFNINIAGINDFSEHRYRILNGNGMLVTQGTISSANTQFDITRLPAGHYYVQLMYRNKLENTLKIILQH
jgi:hypothetical protein